MTVKQKRSAKQTSIKQRLSSLQRQRVKHKPPWQKLINQPTKVKNFFITMAFTPTIREIPFNKTNSNWFDVFDTSKNIFFKPTSKQKKVILWSTKRCAQTKTKGKKLFHTITFCTSDGNQNLKRFEQYLDKPQAN